MSIEYKGHWDALRMLNRKRPLSYRARLVVGEEGGKRGILRPSLFPLLPPCDPCYTNPLQATLSLRPIHSTVFTPTFDHHRSSQCLTYNSKFNFVWIALMTVRNMVKKIPTNAIKSLMTPKKVVLRILTWSDRVACSGRLLFANSPKTS